jgi:VCBS repeat-containing protein
VSGTLEVTITGANDAPVIDAGASDLSAAFVEDAGPWMDQTGRIAFSDADQSDALTVTVSGVAISGNAGALSEDQVLALMSLYDQQATSSGWQFSADNGLFDYLDSGESVTFDYTISVDDGSETRSTVVSVTVTGTNDAPTVSGGAYAFTSEDGEPVVFNLLDGASDAEGEALAVTDVTVTTSTGEAVDFTLDPLTGALTIDPGQFDSLPRYAVEVLDIRYAVVEADTLGTGGGYSVPGSATLVIEGANDAPTVTAIDAGVQGEDDGVISVDLVATASDVDAGDVVGIEEIQSVASSNPDRTIVWGLDPNNYDAVQLDLDQFSDLQDGESETVTITYLVGDGRGGATPNTATFVVTGTNDLPTFVDFTLSLTESEPLWVNLLASVEDVDSDTVIATDVSVFTDNPDRVVNANIDLASGTVTLPYGQFEDLAEGQVEILTISFNLDDGDGGVVPRTLSFTVIGQNDAPEVVPINAGTVGEDDGSISVDLMATASDIDNGDIIGIEEIQSVSSSNPDRAIVWGLDPNNYDAVQLDLDQFTDLQDGETETVTITYLVGDNRGGVTQNTATFVVTGTNDLPTFVDFTLSLTESEPLWVNLLASVEDVDSDTVIATDVSVFTDNPDRVVNANIDLANGTVTLPYGQFEDLAEGQVEILTISFNLDDGDGGIVPRTLSFTVIGQNDAPEVVPINAGSVGEDDGTVSVDLMATASDIDNGDIIGIEEIQSVSSSNPDRAIVWGLDPNNYDAVQLDLDQFTDLQEGESETVTITYLVGDNRGGVTQNTATFVVTGTNDLPTFVDFTLSLTESEPLWVNLLASVGDVDSDTVIATDVSVFTDNPDREVTANIDLAEGTVRLPYGQFEDLAEGEVEILTISFNLDDGDGGIVPRTLSFTVIGQNDAPYFEPWNSELEAAPEADAGGQLESSGVIGIHDPDTSDVYSATTLSAALSGNLGDVTEADVLGLLSFDPGAPGASVGWTFAADADLFAHLATGETLTLEYQVEVSDGHESVTVPVTITITGQNAAPDAPALAVTMPENGGFFSADLLDGASDADGDSLSVSNVQIAFSNPDRNAIYSLDTQSGSITFYPGFFEDLSEGESETITLSYDVEDGQGGVTPRTLTVTVEGSNDGISLNGSASFAFGENDAAVLSESGTMSYSDADANDTHTASVTQTEARGATSGLAGVDLASLLTLDAQDGVLSWSFDADASLFDYLDDGEPLLLRFTVELSDGFTTGTAVINVSISGSNDVPVVSGTVEATLQEGDAATDIDLLALAADPEGDAMAVTGVTVTAASGAAVDFTVDAFSGALTIDPAQFAGLDAGETETLTVSYGVAEAETVISGGSDSIPTIGNAGRWFVVNFDTGNITQEARSSGNSAEPYSVPDNGVVFHFNGNNADYNIGATVYVDGVATPIDPAELEIEGYSGAVSNGDWLRFENSINDATVRWSGTVETADGPQAVSFTFDGLSFVDNQVGNSTLDSFSVEVSGPSTPATAEITIEGEGAGGASMQAIAFTSLPMPDTSVGSMPESGGEGTDGTGWQPLSEVDGQPGEMSVDDVNGIGLASLVDAAGLEAGDGFTTLSLQDADAFSGGAGAGVGAPAPVAPDMGGLAGEFDPLMQEAVVQPTLDTPEGW